MTDKQLHSHLIKQAKSICDKEYMSIPIIKKDNRIGDGGHYESWKNKISYSTKCNLWNKDKLLMVILHELGHHLHGHNGNGLTEHKEYLAENFTCYCIINYYPDYIYIYKTRMKNWFPFLKKEYLTHYKAFKRVYEENFNEIIK